MRVRLYIFMYLLIVVLTSMTPKKDTLLVLSDTLNEESFSKFLIVENDGVLIGINVDDYNITDGIYRIKASSNDKYYNRNIIIVN